MDMHFDIEQFVYIKIPADIDPLDRSKIFEAPIDAALASKGLGEVSGGGSLLGNIRSDGTRPIEFSGIDVDTNARETVLAILRKLLPGLGSPVGTELHYTAGGFKLQNRFFGADGIIGDARDFLHPGFDV